MLIEERTLGDAGLRVLLDAAFQELVSRYGAEGRSGVHPDARYLVALVDDQPVGCGVVQPAGPTVGELKRMFVLPEHRGRGVARSLLRALEDLARDLGYDVLRLATGVRQPGAIALYEASGFTSVPPYGKYVADPLSRCYQKPLGGHPHVPFRDDSPAKATRHH